MLLSAISSLNPVIKHQFGVKYSVDFLFPQRGKISLTCGLYGVIFFIKNKK